MPSASPILDLIIAASVDPSGIKRGLGESEGFLRAFGKTADQELRESFKQFGKTGENAGSEAGLAIIGGLRAKLAETNNTLTEQLARGVLSNDQFKKLGAEAGQSYNQALLASIESLRARGILSPDMQGQLIGALDKPALNAGLALEKAFGESGSGGIAIQGMGRIRQGLTSLLARYTETIPVLDRVGASMLTMGAGGTVSLAVIAGLAAIAGAYHYATKEATELKDAQDKLVEAFEKRQKAAMLGPGGETVEVVRALQARVDEQKTQLSALLAGGQYQSPMANMAGGGAGMGGGGNSEAARKEMAEAEVSRMKEIARIRAEIAQGEAEIADKSKTANNRAISESINAQAALIESGKANAAQLRNAREEILAYNRAIDLLKGNGARLGDVTDMIALRDRLQTALDGKPAKTVKETKPFEELTSGIGELTKAIELAELRGDRAANTIFSQLVTKRNEAIAKMASDPKGAPGTEGGNYLQTAILDANNALGLSVEKVISRYTELQKLVGTFNADTLTAGKALSDMIATLGARIQDQGGFTRASTTLVTQYQQAVEALKTSIAGIKMPEEFARGLAGQSLGGQTAQFKIDESAATVLKRAGSDGSEAASQALERSRERLSAMALVSLTTDRQATETATQYAARIKEAADAWSQLNPKIATSRDVLNDVITSVHGIVDGLSGLGLVGPALTAAANGALHTATAIQAMKKQADSDDGLSALGKIAGTIGVLGGVTSAIGGLISMFSQHDATLQKNNEALTALRISMLAPTGVTGMQAISGAISGSGIDRSQDRALSPALGLDALKKVTDSYLDALRTAGVTQDQVNAIAKSLGITLDGSTASYASLNAALKLAIQASGQFGQSLADQSSLAALRDRVYNKDRPQDAIKSTIDVLSKFAPDLAKNFAGINAATADGQAQLRTALRALFDQLAAGTIDPKTFGTLNGAKDLAAIIGSLQGNLDALSKAAAGTTASLLFVPQGFKVALAAFNAMDPVTPKQLVTPPTSGTGTPVPTDGSPGLSPSSGATAAVAAIQGQSSSRGGDTYNFGGLTINGAGQSPEELFTKVLKVAQRRAQTTYGRSDQWSQVQKGA